ncbi:MAG: pimeloyl-ACP methyl ester carboxylesterase [Myxococcota bacterium]|jgi:pimeloyl-ACP methyl ester carboxylesterase
MREYTLESGVNYVKANGITHAYISEGEGPLVLMMHGFPDTPHTFDEARPTIAKAGFRVVTPFLRGYAPSDIPDTDTDLKTQGEDVLALIKALGYDEAILVGHDWGASAVYAAAALDSKPIRKLITVGIPHPACIRPSLKLAWAARHFVTLRLPGALAKLRSNDFKLVEELTHRWGPTWQPDPSEFEAVKNVFSAPGSANAALGYYRKMTPPPKWMQAIIDVPTIAIAGRDDPNISPDAFEPARRFFSAGYRVIELAGGHFCHREEPDVFASRVLAFIHGDSMCDPEPKVVPH